MMKKQKAIFHGFNDSATFIYPFKIKKQDSATIKGSFAWLGKKAMNFQAVNKILK